MIKSHYFIQFPENIYIHVPFCIEKCDYCTFYSLSSPPEELVTLWLKKICSQLSGMKEFKPVNSIYIGGGTPSILSPKQLEKFLLNVFECVPHTHETEISMECNPSSLSTEKISVMSAFVSRVTLGVQSFEEKFKAVLGRNEHSSLSAIDKLLKKFNKHGIYNLGVDLIYGIPGQTIEEWKQELLKTVSLDVSHISTYALTIEEGTKLYKNYKVLQVYDDIQSDMWKITEEILEKYSFMRYEISNYAKNHFYSRHNLNIWQGETYLGIGPSAVSFNGLTRWKEVADLEKWLLNVSPVADKINPYQRAKEVFIMGLRTKKGVNPIRFMRRTKYDCSQWFKFLIEKYPHSFFDLGVDNFTLSDEGLLFWNEIAEDILFECN